ncbi:hypothetical protein [Paraburkholderia aspalathi]|uniref:hypothetical protein n=1 Tax=Paraburkholderia aspalathi TaxID=1324617 RepID=UPI0038BBABC7
MPPVKEAAAVVHRQWTTQGKTLSYTTTTGHLTTQPLTGGNAASMFYVAYTLNGEQTAQRPVTFFFNGSIGGIPAVFLNILGWAPIRMRANTGTPAHPVYPVGPSPDSLLDKSDLVFIDPPGIGFSEAIAPAKNRDFNSLDSDASAFRDFISHYMAVNHRTDSPVYLYGESDGAGRAAVLTRKLNAIGMPPAGAILNSPATGRYEISCTPKYDPERFYSCAARVLMAAAVSHYYGLVGKGIPQSQFMNDVMKFTHDVYLPQEAEALKKQTLLPDETITRLAEYTGFDKKQWQKVPVYWDVVASPVDKWISLAHLDCTDFNNRNEGTGDCPSTGYDWRKIQDEPSAHLPQMKNLYRYAQNIYASLLGYSSVSDYALGTQKSGEGWRFDTVPVWADAMKDNKKLRILTISGYYDEMAPFYSAMLAFSDKSLDASRIWTTVFEGGHQTYLTEQSRPGIRAVIDRFYDAGAAANSNHKFFQIPFESAGVTFRSE